MNFNSMAFFVLAAVFFPSIVLIPAIYWERRRRKSASKSPQSEKLLRPPAYSLTLRLEKIMDKFMDLFVFAAIYSTLSGAGISIFAIFGGLNLPFKHLITPFLAALIFAILCIRNLLRAFNCFKEIQNVRLGISGEQAVAEALNEASQSGFRSFHDFPAEENWNIDHVAVGENGIFLIETKAIRRRASRNGQAEHEVIFDGNFLQFPFFKTNQPIEQAKNNAKWLTSFLEKKTGEKVRVEPLVVLPGWFVKNSEKGNFPVKAMNTNFLIGFLQRQNVKIDPAQVRRIIAALDEKCRDVEF